MTQQAGSESDIRFQFETIKLLAESVRQMTTEMTEFRAEQRAVSERLIRIEENMVNDTVAALAVRVDVLERDKDRRDGASGVISWIFKSPVIGWIVAIAAAGYAVVGKVKL